MRMQHSSAWGRVSWTAGKAVDADQMPANTVVNVDNLAFNIIPVSASTRRQNGFITWKNLCFHKGSDSQNSLPFFMSEPINIDTSCRYYTLFTWST